MQHMPFSTFHVTVRSDIQPRTTFQTKHSATCTLCEAALPRAVREQPASTATLTPNLQRDTLSTLNL